MAAIGIPLRLQRERTLRSRATRGDSAAFTAVYERHHQALYRYCRSIVRHEEDAQDALQSTMTRAFAALQDEQRDFELRPWLFRIAHNESVTILRHRPASSELDDQPALGEMEDRVADREELRLLQMDLADLPERQRAALILRELNGLSHIEIGEVLGISTAAVKQAIFDARSALLGFREGRETACTEIRRMLSDGDGRVLRGRGVRGHLRACPDCRRFRADLERRPVALRALIPPLPVGGAAALLAQIIGGGTAVKLIACIALVGGGGATLATEMRDARSGARPAEPIAEARQKPKPPRKPKRVVAPVATSAPQPAAVLVSEPTAGVAATPRRAPARAAKTPHAGAKLRAAKRARAAARKAHAAKKLRGGKKARAALRARAAMAHRGSHGRSARARAAKAKWAKAAKAWRAKLGRRAAGGHRGHSGRGRHGRSARSSGSHRGRATRATRSARPHRARAARSQRRHAAPASSSRRARPSVRRVFVKARRTAAPRGRRGSGSHHGHR